ncbi:nucleotidyltransferase domain-containing protein [Candidatus Pacearchaeota archaeon]|nr:nucleotidyltransferase domain-containing protein [Candidatus Pacearchaeota archaeon]
MDKQSAKIAKEFSKRIKKKFGVQKLILFGSRARGDNFKNSDYDFIVVSDKFKHIKFILRASDFYEYWDKKTDLEIICYTPEEFERKKKQIGIVKTAVEEGVEI